MFFSGDRSFVGFGDVVVERATDLRCVLLIEGVRLFW